MKIDVKKNLVDPSGLKTGTPFWHNSTLYIYIGKVDWRTTGGHMGNSANCVQVESGALSHIVTDVEVAKVKVVRDDV